MLVDSCYKIGYVLKPHGLKGEVTISIDADAPEDLDLLESVFIEKNSRLVPYFIEAMSIKGDKAYVKFEEIDSHESAASISKSALYLPKTSRPKSGKGEFYDDEILDFEVHDSELGFLGKIAEVTAAGPNKLLSIMKEEKEVLIPLNSPFIISINKSKKRISVTLPEGFLDI
jgi:16S rRNA processing protein RimM